MWKAVSAICVIILMESACNKKDISSLPPVTVSDSMLFIQEAIKIDPNEFDIIFKAKPEPNEVFSSVHLEWSISPTFSAEKDSVFIPSPSGQMQTYRITGLKESTKYYGRIKVFFKGQTFYSSQKEWVTDSLRIVDVGFRNRGFNRGDTLTALTNLRSTQPTQHSDTKIFIGSYECPLILDEGLTLQFRVPATIPAGKYFFKIFTKGMDAQIADPMPVLRGRWSYVTPPDIPVNPTALTKGLMSFGTCSSSQKGYLVGGRYLNGLTNFPDFILEFDGAQEKWSKRFPPVPRYFEDPITYYFNNAIYLISGREFYYTQQGNMEPMGGIRKMLKLDLGSLQWTPLDSVPYPTVFSLTSFEINQEWYVGMGADSANQSACCGMPLPSKKFWKYSPGTDTWSRLADFPGGHQLNPTCFSIGKKGYAFYGAIPVSDQMNTTIFTQELWEYNSETNTWSQIPLPTNDLILPKGEKYQVVTYNGKAYFLSGQVGALASYYYTYHLVQPFVEWDPVKNEFSPISFPFIADITKMIFNSGNKFYFQTDKFGYIESLSNKTYKLEIEQ